MKKLTAIIALGLCLNASAQKSADNERASSGTTFSVGVEPGIPVGLLHYAYSFVIGGSLQAEKHLGSSFSVTGTTGYKTFIGKSISDGTNTDKIPSFSYIPVLIGGKYYITSAVFAHAQLGVAVGTSQGGGTAFEYAPSLGLNISRNIDAALQLSSITSNGFTTSQVGLRVGYNF